MSPAAKSMSDDERERIVAAIVADSAEILQRYSDADKLAFEMLSNLAMARA